MDLRLPDELIALFTEAPETEASESDQAPEPTGTADGTANDGHRQPGPPTATGASTLAEAHADRHADTFTDTYADTDTHAETQLLVDRMPADLAAFADDDLLDNLAEWGPTSTPAGVFRLVPVRVERDLPLISRWMNDPAVAAFWELDGPDAVTEAHLRPQLEGDGRSVPCLGVLDGAPISYWEIYRADLDPVARHYPARPHDTGIHLLIGGVAHRGRGLGTTLLRAVADLVLDHRPRCTRVIAEPDLRNTPSVSAFLSAGFRFSAEIELPGKRAALMVRDRVLRHLLHPGHS
ncbi:GNAT family N-acetyltransferase [Streptomyces sp. NPDC002896]|uniref:GNAT family N-acetyltransferase n=1 Tax=Streptomyces sp. NPDC002896 TaxID=3154438 RepID=UPI003332C59A